MGLYLRFRCPGVWENKTEVWDAYNSQFKKIEDLSLIRRERIPDGVYHLVSDILVKHIDGNYLLMQRDAKKHFGGLWEASAGGSAIKGEDARSCAIMIIRWRNQSVIRLISLPNNKFCSE